MNLVGLVFNALGSFILLWYPPAVTQYTEAGEELRVVTRVTSLERSGRFRWRYWMQLWGYRVGMVLLLFGFVLQFVAGYCN